MDLYPTGRMPITEVLTNPDTGARIGYLMTGDMPGPAILVAGHSRAVESAYAWICERHDLMQMCGVLGFLHLNALDNLQQDISDCPLFPSLSRFDDVHFLPYSPGISHTPAAARQGARSIVLLCRRMHILPRRKLAPPTGQQYLSGPIH